MRYIIYTYILSLSFDTTIYGVAWLVGSSSLIVNRQCSHALKSHGYRVCPTQTPNSRHVEVSPASNFPTSCSFVSFKLPSVNRGWHHHHATIFHIPSTGWFQPRLFFLCFFQELHLLLSTWPFPLKDANIRSPSGFTQIPYGMNKIMLNRINIRSSSTSLVW